jgi:hypothetical protein
LARRRQRRACAHGLRTPSWCYPAAAVGTEFGCRQFSLYTFETDGTLISLCHLKLRHHPVADNSVIWQLNMDITRLTCLVTEPVLHIYRIMLPPPIEAVHAFML